MCRDKCEVNFFQARNILMSREGQWLCGRGFVILLTISLGWTLGVWIWGRLDTRDCFCSPKVLLFVRIKRLELVKQLNGGTILLVCSMKENENSIQR